MSLQNLLEEYQPQGEYEMAMKIRFRKFLSSAPGNSAFERELSGNEGEKGHVTGSSWLINEDGTRVVLVHHAKLGKWVQPGGHCDGESDVLQVALREAREETALDAQALSPEIFDVDIHFIPEYWNTPAHWHYDVRFLLSASDETAPIASHESHAARWVSLDEALELSGEESIARMVATTRERFGLST